ncbi:MAG: DUF86 domain-containing protein [Anaerolineae bacterium]|nr:DUF86 domain-containing protein [Anaerolineae bacterium]NUQ05876.1 DUF86 domain-containing protein [Anaerolineae bacterium]
MRNDEVLLLDVLIAARRILEFVGKLDFAAFEHDEKTKSAVIREIQVIGEASRLLSSQAKENHSAVDWAAMAGMRNRVIHEYFNIDVDIVWDVIQNDIPALAAHLSTLLPASDEE